METKAVSLAVDRRNTGGTDWRSVSGDTDARLLRDGSGESGIGHNGGRKTITGGERWWQCTIGCIGRGRVWFWLPI